MREPEETPVVQNQWQDTVREAKAEPELTLLVEEDPEKALLSKIDVGPIRSGNCYICAKQSNIVGKIKGHGGVICLDCGILFLT